MRAILLACVMGGMAMIATDDAEAQEKKVEPIPLKEPFKMYVTVKPWTGKMFLNAASGRPAYWYVRDDGKKQDKDGNDLLAVFRSPSPAEIKTEITDADGGIWIVSGRPDVQTPTTTVYPVKKKAAP